MKGCGENIRNAVLTIRNELLKKEDLYDGFLASIKSALDEIPTGECGTDELAKHILGRIVGENEEK
jgi:hypothetical protein